MKLFWSTIECCVDASGVFFLFASVVHVAFLQGNQFADLARGKITRQQNEKEAKVSSALWTLGKATSLSLMKEGDCAQYHLSGANNLVNSLFSATPWLQQGDPELGAEVRERSVPEKWN